MKKPSVLVRAAFFFFTLIFSVLTLACHKPPVASEQERIKEAEQRAIYEYVRALPDEQKISQLFLVNVEGDTEFVPVEKTGALYGNDDEGDPLVPGGCLLFSYNIADAPEKIAAYTASIRHFYAENNMVPPYVAIDQEGGYVNRLRGITSNLVSQKKVTEWFSAERAHDLYAVQAKQLRLLGVNMNLAPVVEVETAENAAFLDTRSFGTLKQVLAYGKAAISAYEENGVATVLKHFPGNSNTDPHTGLPQISLDLDEVQAYLAPFTALLPLSSAVLMSHAVVRVVGEHTASYAYDVTEATAVPACFSPYWVDARARNGFDGLIFSDDIFMGALADNGYPPEVAVVSAVKAGVNCIMLSEKQFGAVAGVLLATYKKDVARAQAEKGLASLAEAIDLSVYRVIAYKIKAGLLQFVPVPNKAGKIDAQHPAYSVAPVSAVPAFDAAAFKVAYDEGMRFYQ